MTARRDPASWTPESWQSRPRAHQFTYDDDDALTRAIETLRRLPPLVTSWEIESLKGMLAEAQEGKRFVLQGGDCAESLDACTPDDITARLKILLQMSLILVQGTKRPVVRIGRFAGQYAKPRSSPTETRTIDGRKVELPSYFGDLVNAPEFDARARTPDPARMVRAYHHAGLTLNFVRSLCDAGFADLHHPEYWDLKFLRSASLSEEMRARYESMSAELASALRFMEALGEKSVDDLSRVRFFASHEGLNLYYESALTRRVPRRTGWYNLSTHLPWIGERTRALDGAHVEYFRGIENPVAIKIGPAADPVELLDLIDALNPDDEPGKIVLITRMGADQVASVLPRLVHMVQRAGRRVLWLCDPMHANGIVTPAGVKTRRFDDILSELEQTCDIHAEEGRPLGGVHFELTGQDVTECVGGATGLCDEDLHINYQSTCDPRLNYEQSIEMAFLLANKLGR